MNRKAKRAKVTSDRHCTTYIYVNRSKVEKLKLGDTVTVMIIISRIKNYVKFYAEMFYFGLI